jgi:hypothetical protein
MWLQRLVAAFLMSHEAGLIKHIPASPSSMLWERCWCVRGIEPEDREEWLRRKQITKRSILPF